MYGFMFHCVDGIVYIKHKELLLRGGKMGILFIVYVLFEMASTHGTRVRRDDAMYQCMQRNGFTRKYRMNIKPYFTANVFNVRHVGCPLFCHTGIGFGMYISWIFANRHASIDVVDNGGQIVQGVNDIMGVAVVGQFEARRM